jgi:hypothetical protein
VWEVRVSTLTLLLVSLVSCARVIGVRSALTTRNVTRFRVYPEPYTAAIIEYSGASRINVVFN